MIDHGESSIPALCDFNADGLIDIVIGASGNYILTSEKEPSLFLYQNTGTQESPSLEYLRDWSNESIIKELIRFPGLGKKTASCAY